MIPATRSGRGHGKLTPGEKQAGIQTPKADVPGGSFWGVACKARGTGVPRRFVSMAKIRYQFSRAYRPSWIPLELFPSRPCMGVAGHVAGGAYSKPASRSRLQTSWSGGLSGRDGGNASVILNSPLPLCGQVLRRVAGRAILPVLKLLPARFRTHSIAGTPRV
jgi:hypothetical protein